MSFASSRFIPRRYIPWGKLMLPLVLVRPRSHLKEIYIYTKEIKMNLLTLSCSSLLHICACLLFHILWQYCYCCCWILYYCVSHSSITLLALKILWHLLCRPCRRFSARHHRIFAHFILNQFIREWIFEL